MSQLLAFFKFYSIKFKSFSFVSAMKIDQVMIRQIDLWPKIQIVKFTILQMTFLL